MYRSRLMIRHFRCSPSTYSMYVSRLSTYSPSSLLLTHRFGLCSRTSRRSLTSSRSLLKQKQPRLIGSLHKLLLYPFKLIRSSAYLPFLVFSLARPWLSGLSQLTRSAYWTSNLPTHRQFITHAMGVKAVAQRNGTTTSSRPSRERHTWAVRTTSNIKGLTTDKGEAIRVKRNCQCVRMRDRQENAVQMDWANGFEGGL